MMKYLLSAVVLAGCILVASSADATLYGIDLSPSAAAALNLGTNPYPGDGAPGLSPANEPALPIPGTATGSGGEIGGGITYDDITNMLDLNVAFGAAFGFTDLGSDLNTGAAGGIHIHGPQNPGMNAGIVFNLSTLGLFTPSGNRAGSAAGLITLDAAQETILLDNQFYLNIHSLDNPGGEIRGQLVITEVIPEPASCLLMLLAIVGIAGAIRYR